MNDPRSYFDANDEAQISAAIAKAEKNTSAEIIPVVAAASGRYDRAEDLFGVVFALVVLAIIDFTFQAYPVDSWGLASPLIPMLAYLIGGLLLFAIGAALASRFVFLRSVFISKTEMDDEVERRAREAFQTFRLRSTEGASGVLLFISIYERRVRVLGDDAVAAHLRQADWDQVRDVVIDALHEGDACRAIIQGVQAMGQKVAPHLPRSSDDRNELADTLRYMQAP